MGCEQSVPKDVVVVAPTSTRFSVEEVAKHNRRDSLWVVVDGVVYQIPPSFLLQHPGGEAAITRLGGSDATRTFNSVHSLQAKTRLKEFMIGTVAAEQDGPAEAGGGNVGTGQEDAGSKGVPTGPAALTPDHAASLQLIQRINVNHNTRIFRFALPSPQHCLGVPCGMHVQLSAPIAGEPVTRPYTPISSENTLGHVDLLVKVYFAGTDPKHPLGGKMSQHLEGLKLGDTVAFKGPVGRFVYEGRGSYTMNKRRGAAAHLSMVAGGSGITPLYAVVQAVLGDARDSTTMSLLCANSSEEDILLKPELDAMAQKHPERLKVWHVVSKPAEGWQQGKGHISQEMMAARLFPAGPETLGLICGPPALLDSVCLPGLTAMGYKEESIVRF